MRTKRSEKISYIVTSPDISARMRRIRSENTGLERSMEVILRILSIRYDSQPNILGHPDFRIKGTKVLIFCDSSFWHGRRQREIDGTAFSKNRELWTKKLLSNKLRDVSINRKLRKLGWSVQRFWDTDILYKPDKVRTRLVRVVHLHASGK